MTGRDRRAASATSPGPRRALITGSTRGLGATLARFLGAEGWEVHGVARHRGPTRAPSVARPDGPGIRLQIADVASSAGRRRIAERSRAGGRRLELLIHNASDLGASPLPPLIEYPIDRWRRVMETNLWGPVDLTRRLRRELAAAGGLVVNISSDAALGGYPGWGGYGSSKAALDLASLTLAHELRADRIAVVSVDPGDMRTVMHQAAYPGQDISDRPLPEVTLPFWIWLLGQDRMKLSGRRFRAQATNWEVSP